MILFFFMTHLNKSIRVVFEMSSSYLENELLEITPSSSTKISQEPWDKVQSTYAEKRKKIQAERMRQLKELEDQVTETANWNQKRKEFVSTSSRRLSSEHFIDNSRKSDLGDATLEDLEGLIAASAKRLASYRLRNNKKLDTPSPQQDKWNDILNSESPTTTTTTEEKSPSASYLRLRSMFESNNNSNNKNTLLSSKAPISPKSPHLTLVDLANPSSPSTSSARRKVVSESHKKEEFSNGIISTRSAISTATPKVIESSPRVSSSSQPPRTSFHLKKATRNPTTISPSSSTSTNASSSTTTIRTRKTSTLASLQQRQQQQEGEGITQKVKLSVTAATITPSTGNSTSQIKKITAPKSNIIPTVVRRKRGKVSFKH